ncbi:MULTISPECIES: hypothetical protein [unclassified Schlesneria]|uniref:hypothetical protein n=1 Tax=Schlesneria TaxID=656899 RepID=UPI002EE9E7AC
MTATTHQTAVIGVFRNHADANNCYLDLLRRGFKSSDINLMMSDETRTQVFSGGEEPDEEIEARVESMDNEGPNVAAVAICTQRKTKQATQTLSPEGMGLGGSIGTIAGATLAALAAAGTTVVIPGLSLVVAGPLMAAFAGGGAGALAGGIIGGLAGIGVPAPVAEDYRQALFDGGAVISVQTRPEDGDEVVDLMTLNAGEHVTRTEW